jgi:hypothetical protein
MKTMIAIASLSALVLCSSAASAQHAAPALAPSQRYTNGSLSLVGSAAARSNVRLDDPSSSINVSVSGELRWLYRGFVLSPRAGIVGGFNSYGVGPLATPSATTTIGGHVALLAGLLRPLTESVSIGALLGYRLLGELSSTAPFSVERVAHSAVLEVPFTVHVSNNVLVEPALVAEWWRSTQTARLPGSSAASVVTALSIGAEIRLGYTM